MDEETINNFGWFLFDDIELEEDGDELESEAGKLAEIKNGLSAFYLQVLF